MSLSYLNTQKSNESIVKCGAYKPLIIHGNTEKWGSYSRENHRAINIKLNTVTSMASNVIVEDINGLTILFKNLDGITIAISSTRPSLSLRLQQNPQIQATTIPPPPFTVLKLSYFLFKYLPPAKAYWVIPLL